MRKTWFYILVFLCLVSALVWFSTFSNTSENLKIVACDVGQGDALLITLKTQQILVDGGPNNKVLSCLSDNMPFWDRNIELVILTHPEKDHYSGLIDVFENYYVANFITSGLFSSSQEYQVLKEEVGSSATKVLSVEEGSIIRLGLIRFEIFWPSKEFLAANSQSINEVDSGVLGAFTTSRNKNEFSVVGVLSFGNFDALLTGDIENEVSDAVAEKLLQKNIKDIEYIKIPHHGSKNGLSEKLLDVSNPNIAVISVAHNNSYGHPHQETLNLLEKKGIRVLRTDERGEIIVGSDGEKSWLEN
jgi:competence protein ComEC